ncbi:hypothetical protein [Methanocella conradii]|uniref:hypothetical protein n=1 Tax=Methanocella conradii TaxID=1175444 RepID=UPI00117E493C|nr:hypothetical protein [Methanocella conradii]MDI6897789.1 hypothetical protein [Methanocella conradii]
MAYAQDWSKYNGRTETTYSGGNPSINQYSNGGKGPVAVNDRLFWDNTMHNNVGRSVTAYVGGITAPPFGGGLAYNEVSISIPPYSARSNDNHAATVAIAGPHVILAYHSYEDGNYIYTINHDQMSYT